MFRNVPSMVVPVLFLWQKEGQHGKNINFKTSADGGQDLPQVLLQRELVAPWNTKGIMAWAWMLRSPYALAWFGHGCSRHRMLLEYERNYCLGMDAPVSVCAWNTNGIIVWAWMLWSGRRMLLEYERNYCLGMDALVWSPYALGIRMVFGMDAP